MSKIDEGKLVKNQSVKCPQCLSYSDIGISIHSGVCYKYFLCPACHYVEKMEESV
jgi:hypothetical protein